MNVTGFPDLELAREQAAEWIARIDRGLAPEERSSLRRWREASPANERALRQLAQLWNNLDVMQALAQMFPEHEQEMAAPQAGAHRPPRRGLRTAVAAGLAAATVLAGIGAWLYTGGGMQGPAAVTATAISYTTAVGEQREVPLADGSSLWINTGSRVEVLSLDGDTRELRLLQGEALFMVAHDPSRPFRVAIGSRVVEAVGTAFDIRLHDDGVIEVLVTDGRVKLLQGAAATSYLDRGQAIRIATDGSARTSTLDEQALAARLAWRDGMVSFNGEPLAEVLEEFSRYTPVRFILADPASGRRPVGGSIPAGNVESLRDALSTNLGLESTLDPDGNIRIGPER